MTHEAQSWASTPGTRKSMRSNKGRDTGPELRLRSALHRRGLRFRVNYRPESDLRRTGDIVFTRARVVVFVDGCFWHGCPAHYTAAKRNAEFWADKIASNRARDNSTDESLIKRGWSVVRIWEHEKLEEAVMRVIALVSPRRH
ncbi:very short patch repair endonuclease [Plantactinospora sp. B6F1]|uniref:very short patch repair endonuclease n=1 Tax=Plantactinospora sp. B6F1 TaxID=3158971 RepID=UPI0032D8EBA4